MILLARAGHFDLLRSAAPHVVAPSAVVREVLQHGPADPAAQAMAGARWAEVVEVPSIPPAIAAWDLGAGESAVLAWTTGHPDTLAILDDRAARRCAATLGVPVSGTLGLVLTAKRHGVIAAARPVVEHLIAAGMYLSPQLANDALQLVGE